MKDHLITDPRLNQVSMLKNKVPFLVLFAALQLLIFSNSFAQGAKKLQTIIVDAGHGGHDAGAVGQYENSLRSKEKDVTLAISKKLVAELRKQLPDVNTIPTRTTDIYQSPTEKANIANEKGGQLFVCIHADSGPLKQGRRQVGTREETRYHVTYKKVKKKKVKISTPYKVTVPAYEYFKMPLQRSGTSVWIFAAHKTSEKLKAITGGGEDFELEANESDSFANNFDFNSPVGRALANLYMTRFFKRSDNLASMVNEEIEKTGRNTFGVNQRQKGIWVLQATNMPAILVETGFINNPEDERYINSEEGQQEMAVSIAAAIVRYKQQIDHTTGAAESVPATASVQTAEPKPTTDYTKRSNNVLEKINLTQNTVTVDLYDNAEVDGDIVSVFLNGKNILDNKTLTDKPLRLTVNLDPTKAENELLIYAVNEGSIPPNTGLMIVMDGNTRHEVHFKADSQKNGVILFTHR